MQPGAGSSPSDLAHLIKIKAAKDRRVRICTRDSSGEPMKYTKTLAAQDAPAVGDVVDTLLLVLQQHNAKEEAVLYPLADRELPADRGLRSEKEQAG
jgi:hypothetical protein